MSNISPVVFIIYYINYFFMPKYFSKILISAIKWLLFFSEEKNFDIRDIGGVLCDNCRDRLSVILSLGHLQSWFGLIIIRVYFFAHFFVLFLFIIQSYIRKYLFRMLTSYNCLPKSKHIDLVVLDSLITRDKTSRQILIIQYLWMLVLSSGKFLFIYLVPRLA